MSPTSYQTALPRAIRPKRSAPTAQIIISHPSASVNPFAQVFRKRLVSSTAVVRNAERQRRGREERPATRSFGRRKLRANCALRRGKAFVRATALRRRRTRCGARRGHCLKIPENAIPASLAPLRRGGFFAKTEGKSSQNCEFPFSNIL